MPPGVGQAEEAVPPFDDAVHEAAVAEVEAPVADESELPEGLPLDADFPYGAFVIQEYEFFLIRGAQAAVGEGVS